MEDQASPPGFAPEYFFFGTEPHIASLQRELLRAGRLRDALSLLYRASLSSAVHRHGATLGAHYTEREVLKAVQGALNEVRAAPGSPDQVTNRIMQIEGPGKDKRSSAVGGFKSRKFAFRQAPVRASKRISSPCVNASP